MAWFSKLETASRTEMDEKNVKNWWGVEKKVVDSDTYSAKERVLADKIKKDMDTLPKTSEDANNQANDVLKEKEKLKDNVALFKEMAAAFENNKWKLAHLEDDFNKITEKIMDEYNKKINMIVENRDNNSLDIQYLNENKNAAQDYVETQVLPQQPEKIKNQTSQLKQVLNSWNKENEQILYWIINNMQEIKDLYNKIDKMKWN